MRTLGGRDQIEYHCFSILQHKIQLSTITFHPCTECKGLEWAYSSNILHIHITSTHTSLKIYNRERYYTCTTHMYNMHRKIATQLLTHSNGEYTTGSIRPGKCVHMNFEKRRLQQTPGVVSFFRPAHYISSFSPQLAIKSYTEGWELGLGTRLRFMYI